MTGRYRMAGKVIEVQSIYQDVHTYCRGYETSSKPDFTVVTAQSDIDYEREKSEREAIAEGLPVQEYDDPYLEELAVYRKIAEIMPDYGTMLFHGSVVAVDGVGYLFTAKSGTGKSTHTRLWRLILGERAVMINDDKPFLRLDEGHFTACGTPYNGKHRLGSNAEVPLHALCILMRAKENRIVRISKQEAYPMLIQQVYRPSDALALKKTLVLVDRLAELTPLYCLRCNMEPEAAEIAYNEMKG